MKKIARNIALLILYVVDCLLSLFFTKKQVAVLMYHSVNNNDWEFSISPEKFESHIKYLKDNHYSFLNLGQFKKFMQGEPDFKRGVLLTFDDGYKDFMKAVPILKKYSAPAVVFIHTQRSSENLGNSFELLSWQDILELQEAGIEIGNHTHSHPNIKELSSEQLQKEISESEQLFKSNLGSTPKVFAYPGGKFNTSAISILSKNSFELAFTINSGLVDRKSDPMRIRRIGIVRETSSFDFAIYLTRASTWYQNIRTYLK